MKIRQRPSIMRHVALTVLLSFGFVKTADLFDAAPLDPVDELVSPEDPSASPVMPCAKSK